MRRVVFYLSFFLANISVYAYWQQDLKYDIKVSLDDQAHFLHGNEHILYINNSPDTLLSIYMHLWPNAYKNNQTALAKQLLKQGNTSLHYLSNDEKGYIDSLDFFVDSKKVNWYYHPQHEDIAILPLQNILLPGDSIEISTPFRVKLPRAGISRLGHLGQAYQITQWYPKPAVYDDKGWHPLYYLDQGEFYSEFASYDVEITLPKNYVIATSGRLVDGPDKEEELIFIAERERFTREFITSDLIPQDSFPASSTTLKTLRFYQDKVHDFAWFADKRWLLMSEEVVVPKTFNKVRVEVMFLPVNADLWMNSLVYATKGLLFYSENVGSYPYSHCSVVDGDIAAGGGMEYPNITVIAEASNRFVLEETIVHEIGHNWFYGILGSNERLYSWMDEGLNSYLERTYIIDNQPQELLSDMVDPILHFLLKEDDPAQERYYWYAYMMLASRSSDQPTDMNAEAYFGDNYGSVVYAKTAVLMNYLAHFVGQEKLFAAIQLYYEKWKFKHPSPNDFRVVLEEELNLDLSWFFDDLLYDNKKVDYQILGVKTPKVISLNDDSLKIELLIKNNSSVKAPIVLDLVRNDSIISSIWFEGFLGQANLQVPFGDYDHIEIDKKGITPDLNRENNFIALRGVFKKIEPFDSRFLLNIPKQDKTQMFYVPFLGYNTNDKLQMGILLYNSLLLEKRWRYLLMPSFGFGSGRLGGYYKLNHSRYFRNSFAHKLNYSFVYRRNSVDNSTGFGYLEKLEPKIQLLAGANSNIKQKIELRYTKTKVNLKGLKALDNEYITASYNLTNKKKINSYDIDFTSQLINYTTTKLWASYEQRINLGPNTKPIGIRFFAGAFLGKSDDLTHRFRVTAENGAEALVRSSGQLINRGLSDYLMDDIYLARFSASDNFLSQQVYQKDGAFRTGLYLGANNNWLTSINIDLPTPSNKIGIYVDGALYPTGTTTDFVFSAGLQITLINNVFEVYLPVANSKNINDNYAVLGLDNYFQKIKFLFNISQYYGLID